MADLRIDPDYSSPEASDNEGVSDLLQHSGLSSPSSVISEAAFSHSTDARLVHFVNAVLVDNGTAVPGELWVDVESGLIVSPATARDIINKDTSVEVQTVDLEGDLISPGFIDAQLNGAFGFDFSDDKYGDGSHEAFEAGLADVSRRLVKTGVTSYCPTLPSTFKHVYHKVLPHLRPKRTAEGAESLGVHLEGPFLSPQKPGCHPPDAIMCAPDGIETFKDVYGEENLKDATIITLAAEQDGVMDTIPDLAKMGITVSLGHSVLNYTGGCTAVQKGASMVTHVYNAMRQPHHRESGLFGLLGAQNRDLDAAQNEVPRRRPKAPLVYGGYSAEPPVEVKKDLRPFYGIIVDGIHVHPSCVRIAYHSHPEGCVLVTDAMSPMGLPSGVYAWSTQTIRKEGLKLFLNGTDTIAGSAVEMDISVRNLVEWADISLPEALKTVTTHPARAIGVLGRKGSLNVGGDADLTILSPVGEVKRVYKLGRKVYQATARPPVMIAPSQDSGMPSPRISKPMTSF
uniref:N-acetylglucosamine-6-phosphate deacetylase n=1 Tax=Blastobotrys adeninivorans TaxID=409370 RepID=A0A060TDA6_BLAAD